MTNTWQIYQARLAALLADRPVPAPSWGRRRAALAPCRPTGSAVDDRDEPLAPLVRLPGVRRPECGPLLVRIQ
jgi:hypothetical protein